MQLIPHSHSVQAGALRAEYADGTLRYLKLGSAELLRMIYFALRDEQWATVPLTIVEQDVQASDDSFVVRYRAQNQQDGRVIVDWEGTLTGAPDRHVEFHIRGTFREAFRSNRAGFCVLHPLHGTSGQPFTVTTPSGERVNHRFPRYIAPHQPATNIQALHWSTADGIACSLEFAGDIFEMEDQRNWTDASYKTYCTPLDQPAPVAYQAGDVVEQRVSLHVLTEAEISPEDNLVRVRWQNTPLDWPTIGSCVPLDLKDADLKSTDPLAQLPLDSLRADLAWGSAGWKEQWQRIRTLAERLGKPLHLVLHYAQGDAEQLLKALAADTAPNTLEAISVVEKGQGIASESFTERMVPLLRQHFPAVKVGIGTTNYFTQLNRTRPNLALADFTFYANGAQVHAFDNASIMETIAGQAANVVSARQFSGDCPVRVSPVGLHARFNPDAAAPPGDQLAYAFAPDERQYSPFTAAWMVGSLAALATAGAAHVDFFDLLGARGLVQGNTLSPAYHVLRRILDQQPKQLIPATSSQPLAVSALGAETPAGRVLYLANHLSTSVTVAFDSGLNGSPTWQTDQSAQGQTVQPSNSNAPATLILPPHHCVELSE